MEFEIFDKKVNGYTAGRDLLHWNIPANHDLDKVIKDMLYEIRSAKLDESYNAITDGEDKLFNTTGQSLGFTLDYSTDYFRLAVGISPRYMYEKLAIIIIEKDIEKSKVIQGYSFGAYGSGIRSREKYYGEFKKSKYKDYIDRWHSELMKFVK